MSNSNGGWLGGALAGIATLAGSAIGSTGSRKSQKRAHQMNLDMWNMTNAYNHPLEQRKRLVEGGYHPALALGSLTNSASTSSTPVVPQEYLDLGQVAQHGLQAYQGIKGQGEQIKHIQANVDNINEDVKLKKQQQIHNDQKTLANDMDNALKAKDLALYDKLKKQAMDLTDANIANVKAKTDQNVIFNRQLDQRLIVQLEKERNLVYNLIKTGDGIGLDNVRKKMENKLLEKGLPKDGVTRIVGQWLDNFTETHMGETLGNAFGAGTGIIGKAQEGFNYLKDRFNRYKIDKKNHAFGKKFNPSLYK